MIELNSRESNPTAIVAVGALAGASREPGESNQRVPQPDWPEEPVNNGQSYDG